MTALLIVNKCKVYTDPFYPFLILFVGKVFIISKSIHVNRETQTYIFLTI